MLRSSAALALLAACRAAGPAPRVPEPAPLPAEGTSPNEYLRRYGGEWVPEIKNVSDGREWQDAFMKKYAAAYRHYAEEWQQMNVLLAGAPHSPASCGTLSCLKRWHDAALAKIKKYVPETYQPLAEGSLNKTYEHYKKIIEAKEAQSANNSNASASPTLLLASMEPSATPHEQAEWYVNHYAGKWVPKVHNVSDGQEWWKNYMHHHAERYVHYAQDSQRIAREFRNAPANAADCHTLGALKEWRDAQMARTKAFVPKAFQGFTQKAVDDKFEQNKARIAREEAAKAAQSANGTAAAVGLAALPEPTGEQQPDSHMDDYANQWIPHPPSGSSSPEWYINHYAGKNIPKIHNASDRHEWQEHFMNNYAGAYQHYWADAERIQKEFGNAPRHASDCHNLAELEQWRDAQRARMEAFVPKMWQRMASESVDREFQANKSRIAQEHQEANASKPVVSVLLAADAQPASAEEKMDYAEQWIPHPAGGSASPEWYINRYAGHWAPKIRNASNGQEWKSHFLNKYAEAYKHYADDAERLSREYKDAPQRASDANTTEQLEAWKGAQLARIHAFIPKTFQSYAEESVEEGYRQNRARIEEEAAKPAAASRAPAASHVALTANGTSSTAVVTVLLTVSSMGALMMIIAFHLSRRCTERDVMDDSYMQV
uniref:Uncharacterized protein n=1 Tax=Alexandrium monilatum TaxID=311494 RepID=A0A7S4UN01_9DINO